MFFNNSAEDGVSGGFAFDSHHTKGVGTLEKPSNFFLFLFFFIFDRM